MDCVSPDQVYYCWKATACKQRRVDSGPRTTKRLVHGVFFSKQKKRSIVTPFFSSSDVSGYFVSRSHKTERTLTVKWQWEKREEKLSRHTERRPKTKKILGCWTISGPFQRKTAPRFFIMPSPFQEEGQLGNAPSNEDSCLGLQVGGSNSHVGSSAISGLSCDPEFFFFGHGARATSTPWHNANGSATLGSAAKCSCCDPAVVPMPQFSWFLTHSCATQQQHR